jgi:dTDP-D-glucose 4,6-dehydratase
MISAMQLIVQISVELGWSPQYGFEAGLDATVKCYMVNRGGNRF